MGGKSISRFLLFFLLLQAGTLRAVTVGDTSFPDEVKQEGSTLVLNGAALRTATIFKAKVYAAALYLKTKSQKEEEILKSTTSKQLRMVFLHDISGEDMGLAWDRSFKENCDPDECARYANEIGQLKALMPSVKVGDEMIYEFGEGKARVVFKGRLKGEINGPAFATRLLSTWIGKAPPTETLKRGLLSQP